MRHATRAALAATGLIAASAASAASAQDVRLAPTAPPAHPAYDMYEASAPLLEETSGGAIGATVIGPEVVALPQIADTLTSPIWQLAAALLRGRLPAHGRGGRSDVAGARSARDGAGDAEWVVNCAECEAEYAAFGGIFLGAASSPPRPPGPSTTCRVQASDRAARPIRARPRTAAPSACPWAWATPSRRRATARCPRSSTCCPPGSSTSRRISTPCPSAPVKRPRTTPSRRRPGSGCRWRSARWAPARRTARAAASPASGRSSFPEAREAAAASDIAVVEASGELLAASEQFARADREAQIAEAGDIAGAFATLIDAWSAEIAKIGTDPDALAALAWERIRSGVDFST